MSAVVLSQMLSAASLSGSRAALTLLAIALGGHAGWIDLPESLSFLSTAPAIAALSALVVLEEAIEGDEELQELLHIVNYATRAGTGAVASWMIAAGADSGTVELASPVVGAMVALAIHELRGKIHEGLRGFGDSILSPRSWLLWLERGGMLGLLIAMLLAPVIALVFVILASAGAAIILLARRRLDAIWFRRACPSCQHMARVDASRCPNCREPLEVSRWRVQEAMAKDPASPENNSGAGPPDREKPPEGPR